MKTPEFDFHFAAGKIDQTVCDLVFLPVFQSIEQKDGKETKSAIFSGEAGVFDALLNGNLKTAAEEESFDASPGKSFVYRRSSGESLSVARIVLCGLGEKQKLKPEKIEKSFRQAFEKGFAFKKIKKISVCVPDIDPPYGKFSAFQAVIDAAYQAAYRSAQSREAPPGPFSFELFGNQASIEQADALAKSRCFAKDLTNTPANLKTTVTMTTAAQNLTRYNTVTVEIIDDVKWIQENMPAFFEVARGSLATDPPKFIRVNYRPAWGKPAKKIALVGKTVIFDTGGYQVKPDNFMNTMKADMTGGAYVLGAIMAAAELKLENLEITAYLAATPNKIDSDAMTPDSIVGSSCGKKIEIRHTDAEGRLTLIDAVHRASLEKPDSILTVATLTGSAARAVGSAVALMSNNTSLRGEVESAAQKIGDPLQTLDIFDDDYEDIKSKLDSADIINTSQNKNRGAQSAAAFVMTGAPTGMSVVHMDIAGADMTAEEKATGIGLKTIIQWLLDLNERKA